MARTWNKPKPGKEGAFLASIDDNQTAERKTLFDAMQRVRSVVLSTEYDELLNTEIQVLLDSIKMEHALASMRQRRSSKRAGRVLIVTGEAGAGKSHALMNAFESRPEFENFGVVGEACPLLSVVAPSPFTLKALGNEIVRKIGYLGERDIPEGEVWPMIRILMKELQIFIIHIDEAQHGDQISNHAVHQAVENTLKRLLQDNDWPLWLILSGLPELARFCQGDRSINRRIHHVRFESLRFPEHAEAVRGTIREISSACPRLDCSAVLSDEFTARLLHAALHQFGILIEFVQDAILECLQTGKRKLSADHFADAYSARTGETADRLNVFLADDWDKIDVEIALYEQPVDDDGNPVGRKQRKPSPAEGKH
ncbi:ATP-binding protein [uncultured Aureimonas sp.]|uniref:ATP-binding protein n=1 Tax=uncultured Aureimonas sp. TaxID=1604662 RepID=UPI0025DA9DA0|nr:ATP-binding protein [uncultured Aureimonas sp.]